MSDSGLVPPKQPLSPPPSDPTPRTPGVPAGWYFDAGSQRQRYWDGSRWTEQFATTATPAPTNQWGGISLALGIVAFILLFFQPGIAIVAGILSVLAGIDGLNKARRAGARRALAIWGIVLGGIPVAIGAFVLLIVFRSS